MSFLMRNGLLNLEDFFERAVWMSCRNCGTSLLETCQLLGQGRYQQHIYRITMNMKDIDTMCVQD